MDVRTILCDLVTFVTPLVDVIQDYDIYLHVAGLLRHWQPTSLTWPDPKKRPDITRHLLEFYRKDVIDRHTHRYTRSKLHCTIQYQVNSHRSDVIVPYLDCLFQHVAQVVYGPGGHYTAYEPTITTNELGLEIALTLNRFSYPNADHIVHWLDCVLRDLCKPIWFTIHFNAGTQATDYLSLFFTSPLFTNIHTRYNDQVMYLQII